MICPETNMDSNLWYVTNNDSRTHELFCSYIYYSDKLLYRNA